MGRKASRVILALILVVTTIANVPLAANAETGNDAQRYMSADGTVYNYYLDENGNPYTYVGSDVVYLALPLEHLRVTDTQKIEELNHVTTNSTAGRASVPVTYYDISDNNSTQNLNSPVYSADVDFDVTSTFTTDVLKVNRQHATVRFKTSNVKKENIFAGKKVNFTFYYFDTVFNEWYSQTYSDKDCTGATGFGIQFSPTINEYIQFDVSKSSKIESLTLEIWTTGLW